MYFLNQQGGLKPEDNAIRLVTATTAHSFKDDWKILRNVTLNLGVSGITTASSL